MKLIPVIMSGGVGSRLWPVSRQTHPKPFMPLPDGDTLLCKTFRRALACDDIAEILTVTNRELLFKTEDEYKTVAEQSIPWSFVLEPFGRNTAAAVTAAALHAQAANGDDVLLLVLAADHLINDEHAFQQAVTQARALAEQGYLVTFGIQPSRPETGFGYIEPDKESPLAYGFHVKRFIEKPSREDAQRYFEAGQLLWNSGMFCVHVGTLLEELAKHAAEVLNAVIDTIAASRKTEGEAYRTLTLDAARFEKVPGISIDYALMERSTRVATIPCHIGWSDVGSWDTVSRLIPEDNVGNRLEGNVLVHEASNNYVRSKERLTALVGVNDLVIVDTTDALLIAHRDKAQDVKHIVDQLRASGHSAHLVHSTVHRPWGTYTVLEERQRFKIKRVVVKPKASLSLQMHHHRSEHWVVVSGMGRIVNGENELLLNTNESTFIRAGQKHRLENPGVIDLVLIEVQSGDYLGEDDIVRFEDIYSRV